MIQFKNLALSEQRNSVCEFKINKNYVLRVEATALGVYRLRCGMATKLNDDNLNARAKARMGLLLARQELNSEFDFERLNKKAWRLSHGNTALEIHSNPFSLCFYKDGHKVLESIEDTAIVFDEENSRYQFSLQLPAKEAIYGLGRTSGNYNRRDQTFVSDLCNNDYSPLAWSVKGWGLFARSLQRVTHKIGVKENLHTYHISVEDNELDIFFFIAEPCDIFNQYSATIGRPGQPPLRAMGVWFEQQEGQDLQGFIEKIDQFEASGFSIDTLKLIPPNVFPIQNDKLNVDWGESRLGDTRRFVANYVDDKKHLCFSSFPGVPVGTPLFVELEDRGWLLADDNGKAYVLKTAYGEVGLLDLTFKDAYKMWEERHIQLLDNSDVALSIDIPTDIPDGVYARQGESNAFLRQLYPLWLEQSLSNAQAFHKTPSEAYVRRSGLSLNSPRGIGVHIKPLIQSFHDVKKVLRQHLTTQGSGIIAQTHQLAVDEPTQHKNVYMRLLALSVFSAGFSLPADNARLPIVFDQKTQNMIRVFFNLRYRLIPYVLGIIEDATRTGLPVQRMMPLVFPNDNIAHTFDEQFMFGPALLVAPILDDRDDILIYLPEGDGWWDLNTGIRYEGGQYLHYTCGIETIPVFGREGHMLCLGPVLGSLEEFNSARILEEVWLFGMPVHNPVVMRNKIRVMQMQGSSYIKGFEGLRILSSEGLEVKRRGAEVRISRER